MSSSGVSPFPLPPPVAKFPIIDLKSGCFTPLGLDLFTKLWAGLQGPEGIVASDGNFNIQRFPTTISGGTFANLTATAGPPQIVTLSSFLDFVFGADVGTILVRQEAGWTAVPLALRVSGGTPGRAPTAEEELYNPPMKAGDKFAKDLPGSLLRCETAPTSNWTLTLTKNADVIGTGTIPAASLVGTFAFAADVTFDDGDLLKGKCPLVADATIVGVAYTLIGTRTQ